MRLATVCSVTVTSPHLRCILVRMLHVHFESQVKSKSYHGNDMVVLLIIVFTLGGVI